MGDGRGEVGEGRTWIFGEVGGWREFGGLCGFH